MPGVVFICRFPVGAVGSAGRKYAGLVNAVCAVRARGQRGSDEVKFRSRRSMFHPGCVGARDRSLRYERFCTGHPIASAASLAIDITVKSEEASNGGDAAARREADEGTCARCWQGSVPMCRGGFARAMGVQGRRRRITGRAGRRRRRTKPSMIYLSPRPSLLRRGKQNSSRTPAGQPASQRFD